MRHASIVLALVGLSACLAETASADTDNTQIKTETTSEIKRYGAQEDPFLTHPALPEETGQDQASREETKAPEQAEYEETLSRWKEKQETKWSGLPEGKFVINASAYTAAADECGKNDGITASGVKVKENRTLACPPRFPFGTKITIEGVGTLTCEDRGGAIKGNKFDIYMETKKEAFEFGRRNLVAEVVQ
jgi:3D (Asp-Asp-Asp) domain-containing protein